MTWVRQSNARSECRIVDPPVSIARERRFAPKKEARQRADEISGHSSIGSTYFFVWIELVTTRVNLLFRFRRRDYGSAFLETVVGRAQPELNDHAPRVPPLGRLD